MKKMIVQTHLGQVEGVEEHGIQVWKGIQYARPPVGQFRFKPPLEPDAWAGIKTAKDFGPAAIQSESPSMKFLGDSPKNQSEDCLYLNVWSPRADDKNRPVMVWIHGGSQMYGSGSSYLYDGSSFARNGDVVVVTMNYRLGVFGFLHLTDLGGEEYQGSGNCAHLDQLAALQWVQENIESFGGDPANVTLFGESAGAVSVGNILSMPQSKGLFQKVILQSGTARAKVSRSAANEMAKLLLAELNVSEGNLEGLESIPAQELLEAIKIFPRTAFGTVGGDGIIAERPEEILAEGFAQEIPTIVGTTKDESLLFTYFDPVWKQADDATIKKLFELTYRAHWPTISKQVVGERELTKELYEELFSEYVFTMPAIAFGNAQATNGAPTWMYRFDYESEVLDGQLKAYHALEIPFVWNTVHHPESVKMTGDDKRRYELAAKMHKAWIAFAHDGNPNTSELPYWPEYDPEQRHVCLFGKETITAENPHEKSLENWKKFLENDKREVI